MKLSFYSLLLFMALFVSGLYLVKYDVQDLKKQNVRLQQQIVDERLAADLLEAEWVYLNRPARLQALAEKYLQVMPMAPRQMISFVDIPQRPHDVAQLGE